MCDSCQILASIFKCDSGARQFLAQAFLRHIGSGSLEVVSSESLDVDASLIRSRPAHCFFARPSKGDSVLHVIESHGTVTKGGWTTTKCGAGMDYHYEGGGIKPIKFVLDIGSLYRAFFRKSQDYMTQAPH